jgi:hypothetical protein
MTNTLKMVKNVGIYPVTVVKVSLTELRMYVSITTSLLLRQLFKRFTKNDSPWPDRHMS